jgi:hypothetical protein
MDDGTRPGAPGCRQRLNVNLIAKADGIPCTTLAQLEAVQATVKAADIEFIDTVGRATADEEAENDTNRVETISSFEQVRMPPSESPFLPKRHASRLPACACEACIAGPSSCGE